MIVKCDIDIESIDGDSTNQTISVGSASNSDYITLVVGQNKYVILLTDIETACRVMRAQGEVDEDTK